MNDESTLKALQQGFAPVPGTGISSASKTETIKAVVTAQPTAQVTQIGQPANFSNVRTQDLVDNNDNVIEFNFTNSTGAAQTIYFSTLFGQPGDFEAFNQQPSAVDFATFTENNSDVPANCGVLKGFNYRAAMMGIIIGNFTIQTDDLAQSNKPLIVGYLTKVLTRMESKRIPSLCDACFNNNDNAYTKEFVGPFAVDKANYLGYQVLNGKTVMIRITIIGESVVSQFTAE